LVLVLDAAKAYLPLLAAERWLPAQPERDLVRAGMALAAVLGHMYSPWLRLRGGKGVATSLGVFLAVDPLAAAIAGATWLLLYAVARVSSIGSLVGATVLVLVMAVHDERTAFLALTGVLYLLIVWKHRDNLARLFRRQENKL
jgi:glycerol-3-phosphate acyltransferase PlsY